MSRRPCGITGRAASTLYEAGVSSAIRDQPSPGTSTLMISGVSAISSGIHAMAALKWSEPTCAAPAADEANASIKTNRLGASTLLDHSKKTFPGSCRVAWVKSSTSRASLRSARDG